MFPPKPRYINPFTDFGFKRIFGEEPNKDLLLDFLNELLKEEQGHITDLNYLSNEQMGRSENDQRVVFDLYCRSENGNRFIVEMQKTKQNFFKDRTLYYATFPIHEQAQRGFEWNFILDRVYTISLLDFVFDEDENEPEKFRYNVKLADIETKKTFYDKLTFIYLELPKFKKSVDELENKFEKWLYVLRNLSILDRIPSKLQGKIFSKLFEVAAISKLSYEEHMTYENNLKIYRDYKNTLETATEDGFEKGKKIGPAEGEEIDKELGIKIGSKKNQIEIAKNMLSKGLGIALVADVSGLSEDEIRRIE